MDRPSLLGPNHFVCRWDHPDKFSAVGKGAILTEQCLEPFRRLEGDWINRWCPEVGGSDPSEKGGPVRRAVHQCLSSSVMVVFWERSRYRVLRRQSMSSVAPHQAPSIPLVSTSPCHDQFVLLAFQTSSPTHPVFQVHRTVCRRFGFRAHHQCQRTALLQSDTGFWFGQFGVASSLFPQSRTARGRWPPHEPSCIISPCQASCSPQLFHSFQTAKRISCTIDDSRGYTQHDTFTEPDTFPHNLAFHIESQFASRSCGDSIIFIASVGHAFELMRSD